MSETYDDYAPTSSGGGSGPYRAHGPAYQMFQPSTIEQVLAQRMGTGGPEAALAMPFYAGAQQDRAANTAGYVDALRGSNAVQQALARQHQAGVQRGQDFRLIGQMHQHGMPGLAALQALQQRGLALNGEGVGLGDAARLTLQRAQATEAAGRGAQAMTEAGLRFPHGQQASFDAGDLMRRLRIVTGNPLDIDVASINASAQRSSSNQGPTIGLQENPSGGQTLTGTRFPPTPEGVDALAALAQRFNQVGSNQPTISSGARVGNQGETVVPPRPGAGSGAGVRTGTAAPPVATPPAAATPPANETMVQRHIREQGLTVVSQNREGNKITYIVRNPRTGATRPFTEYLPQGR